MSEPRETGAIALKIHQTKEKELEDVLKSFRHAIDNNEMPQPRDLIDTNPGKNGKTKRPRNMNIIYTNLLNKKEFGLYGIIKTYCESENINKQKLMPVSKKLSKILWKELSDNHKNFFRQLALKVKEEHEELFPDYEYKPKRKDRRGTFKSYDPKTQNNSRENEPEASTMYDNPIQFVHESTSQVNDKMHPNEHDDFDSQDEDSDDEGYSFPEFPEFTTNPPPDPLQPPNYN